MRTLIQVNGDYKRGILGSIFDKVRSKDESGRKTVDCLPFNKDSDSRKSQQLLDNLLLDCAGGFRSSRDGDGKKGHDSGDSIVQKPYEPPALGKSSRITPVGELEESFSARHNTHPSVQTSGLEPDAVEVLSVIR